MKLKIFKTLKLLVLTLLFLSCSKSGNTTTGNPLVGLAAVGSASSATAFHKQKFKFLDLLIAPVYAFPPPGSLLDSNGNTVVLNLYWINMGEIEFKASETPDSGEVDGDDVKFQGPYTVDLFNSSPEVLEMSSLSNVGLRRIKLKLVKVSSLPASAPAGLTGKSIYISGQVNGHTFSFSTTEESQVEIAGPQAVSPINNKSFLLEFKTADLIKKINLSAITGTTDIDETNRIPATSPCPQIDSSADDLFTCFRKGLETESNLGRDDDGNFNLDTDEDSVK